MNIHGNNIPFAVITIRFAKMFIIVLSLSSAIGHAEIYKWVDENGKVHFDDHPGGANTNKEKVKIKSSETSSTTGTELQERLGKEKKLLEVYEQERLGKDLKKAEQQKKKKKLKKICAEAKDYQKTVDSSSGLYNLDCGCLGC